MKKKLKLATIVAIIEAILALIVGFILYRVEANSIEKKTIETLANYFDGIDENMSYDQVMKFLYQRSQEQDKIIAELKQENKELTSLKAQISLDESNQKAVDSSQQYAESGDLVMALAILEGVNNKTPQMQVMVEDYTKQYEAEIIAEADSLVAKEQYDNAIDLLDDALTTLPQSTLLKQKKEAINNLKPQNFMNALHPYESKGYSEKASGEFMEMGGKRYSNGFQLGTGWESSYAIFNLDSKYTKISGIIGHVDGSGEADKIVTILADGVLIATIDVNYQSLPQIFSIDVTGVRQLKFERTDGSTQTGFSELIIQ